MIKHMTLAALAALVPAAATAACVTADSLKSGIRIDYGDGETELFYAYLPNVIAADYLIDGERTSRTLLMHGLYLSEYLEFNEGRPDPQSRETYSYPPGVEGLPIPQPNETFNVSAVAFIRGDLNDEAQSYDFRAEELIELSGCTYRSIPVELTYPGDTDLWIEYLSYLPDLGISLYVASRDAEGLVEYPALGISAVP
ncbi:MAG: hypothetical protein MK160_02680 [Rhodobacteraceae bacterium]|nr:hypothetical protein [Paracoccaceae bacterium]